MMSRLVFCFWITFTSTVSMRLGRSQAATQPIPEPARATLKSAQAAPSLLLNFRHAPLETVLNYLSDAAGFIIEPHVDAKGLKGTVTVWSDHPVTQDEAFEILNSALDDRGYAAVRNGRALSIYTKEQAQKENIPVRSGANPSEIPESDRIVTQVIPVRFVDAVQLLRDLAPLKPEGADWVANQGANSLVVTDTQANVRHLAEIVSALDTSVTSVSTVRVFKLEYADAKEVASLLKDLFAPSEGSAGSQNAGGRRGRFLNLIRQMQAAAASAQSGRVSSTPVVAVPEERSNSVLVSAADGEMPIIADIIQQIDTDVEDITEVRVFHLKNADAQETSDLLTSLFSDTGAGQQLPNQIRFAGGRLRARLAQMMQSSANSANQSARIQQENRVVAVPDLRTDSVVVSTSKELMPEIAGVIEDLDSDPANNQKVFVFDANNTDPATVEEVLQGLFPAPSNGTSASRSASSLQQGGAGMQLDMRARQIQSQGYNTQMNRMGGFNTGLGTR